MCRCSIQNYNQLLEIKPSLVNCLFPISMYSKNQGVWEVVIDYHVNEPTQKLMWQSLPLIALSGCMFLVLVNLSIHCIGVTATDQHHQSPADLQNNIQITILTQSAIYQNTALCIKQKLCQCCGNCRRYIYVNRPKKNFLYICAYYENYNIQGTIWLVMFMGFKCLCRGFICSRLLIH